MYYAVMLIVKLCFNTVIHLNQQRDTSVEKSHLPYQWVYITIIYWKGRGEEEGKQYRARDKNKWSVSKWRQCDINTLVTEMVDFNDTSNFRKSGKWKTKAVDFIYKPDMS